MRPQNLAATSTIQPVRKAVIPAAGFGTRFLPVTKAVPKEMLPIMGRPVIDFVVAEAIQAGATDILIVLSRGKEAIQRYFDRAPELEARLEGAGKVEALEAIRAPGRGARIHYVYQPEPAGLGDAVAQGRAFAGDDPFLVLLGDTILKPPAAPQLVACYEATGSSCVAVQEVPLELVNRYGIVVPAGHGRAGAGGASSGGASSGGIEVDFPTESTDGSVRPLSTPWFPLSGLVEKPAPPETPSRYAIAARYLFTADLWEALDGLAPGRGGEIQLTDAMDLVARANRTARGGSHGREGAQAASKPAEGSLEASPGGRLPGAGRPGPTAIGREGQLQPREGAPPAKGAHPTKGPQPTAISSSEHAAPDSRVPGRASDAAMYAVPIPGRRFDLGDPQGMLEATVELAGPQRE